MCHCLLNVLVWKVWDFRRMFSIRNLALVDRLIAFLIELHLLYVIMTLYWLERGLDWETLQSVVSRIYFEAHLGHRA